MLSHGKTSIEEQVDKKVNTDEECKTESHKIHVEYKQDGMRWALLVFFGYFFPLLGFLIGMAETTALGGSAVKNQSKGILMGQA